MYVREIETLCTFSWPDDDHSRRCVRQRHKRDTSLAVEVVGDGNSDASHVLRTAFRVVYGIHVDVEIGTDPISAPSWTSHPV